MASVTRMTWLLLAVIITTSVFAWGEQDENKKTGDLAATGQWVDVRAFENLSSAKASPWTAGKTILVATPQTVNTITIPQDRALHVIKGGLITVNDGKVLTLKGPFEAAAQHVFEGGGTVRFNDLLGATSYLHNAAATSRVYPEWWGAKAGDSSNATMSRNVAAFAAALRTRMPVHVNPGYWYINAEINAGRQVWNGILEGGGRYNTTILQTEAAPVFNFPLLYNAKISGLTIEGGTKGITFSTQHNDAAVITITDCVIREQTLYNIEEEAGPSSTELNIVECVLKTPGTLVQAYADYTNIIRCWGFPTGDAAAFINHGGTMTIRNLVGVPLGSGPHSCWVRNDNHVYLENNRFGAEDARGRTILEQWGDGPFISVTAINNFAPTLDYAYKFYKLPEYLTLRDNYGYNDFGVLSKGIWIDPSANPVFMQRGVWKIQERETLAYHPDGTGTANLAAAAEAKATDFAIPSVNSQFRFADMVASYRISDGFAYETSTGIAIDDAATYDFLGAAKTRKITATANKATYSGARNDILSNQPGYPGVFTYVIDLVVTTSSPVNCWLSVNGNNKTFKLVDGLNIMNVVGQKIKTDTQGFSLIFSEMPIGATVKFGRIRVIAGTHQITTVNTVFHDSERAVKPSSGFLTYYKGDRVEFTDPSAGGFVGAVVTTSGSGGAEVWKMYGPIAP